MKSPIKITITGAAGHIGYALAFRIASGEMFFAFFPAGLVLYWFFNTLLSVLQQWRINHKIEASS